MNLQPNTHNEEHQDLNYFEDGMKEIEGVEGRQELRIICWFRNDLRIHDNYMLDRARNLVQQHKAQYVCSVLPIYCFDPRFFQDNIIDRKTRLTGEPKMGVHRAKFLLESVLELKQNLVNIGSELIIQIGLPEKVLPQFVIYKNGCKTKILYTQDPIYEEQMIENKVRKELGPVCEFEGVWDGTLYHAQDVPNAFKIPNLFRAFREKVQSQCKVRKEVESLQLNDLPRPHEQLIDAKSFVPEWTDLPLHEKVESDVVERSARSCMASQGGFVGGESHALKRLKYYVWDSDQVKNYSYTRNKMLGEGYSSKLAPWLANGCLSPRRVYHEIIKYENKRKKNSSTWKLIFELIWRDYFRFYCIKHGVKVFHSNGVAGKERQWTGNKEYLDRWKEGMTGMPMVDANMRELKETGFISNTGRQNVASYLVFDLKVDWRLGADWFEHQLLDYDPAQNYGNWLEAAGLRGGRIKQFDTVWQSKKYDAKGDQDRASSCCQGSPFVFSAGKSVPTPPVVKKQLNFSKEETFDIDSFIVSRRNRVLTPSDLQKLPPICFLNKPFPGFHACEQDVFPFPPRQLITEFDDEETELTLSYLKEEKHIATDQDWNVRDVLQFSLLGDPTVLQLFAWFASGGVPVEKVSLLVNNKWLEVSSSNYSQQLSVLQFGPTTDVDIPREVYLQLEWTGLTPVMRSFVAYVDVVRRYQFNAEIFNIEHISQRANAQHQDFQIDDDDDDDDDDDVCF